MTYVKCFPRVQICPSGGFCLHDEKANVYNRNNSPNVMIVYHSTFGFRYCSDDCVYLGIGNVVRMGLFFYYLIVILYYIHVSIIHIQILFLDMTHSL